MSLHALGIHLTNSAVQVALIDNSRHVLGQTARDPIHDEQDTQQRLHQQIFDMLKATSLRPSQISAIGVAISGLDRQPHSEILDRVLAELFPDTTVQTEHEAVVALFAVHPFGVITCCDTNSVTFGLDDTGDRVWAGGWGDHVDQGGAAIGREVVCSVANAFDGVGGQTALSERVLSRLGLRSAAELQKWTFAADRKAEDFVALADEAVALEDKDAVASGIILRAGDGLAVQVQTVARRLGLSSTRFPLVLAGRLFTGSELLQTLFIQAVQAVLPDAVPQVLTQEYAVCAGMIALNALGIPLPQIDLHEGNQPRRATEGRNPLTLSIQDRHSLDFVRLMNNEDQRVPHLIEPELDRIAALIDLAAVRFASGGRLFFVGAGTSGRLAVLDAAECAPTFSTTLEQVAGILAGGEAAMFHSIEGAEDDEAQGHTEIAMRGVNEHDTVIGVAASGSTPFVVGALREAQTRNALMGCIVNNADSLIASLVRHPIVIATGPEVIMGSTRLKAGTAQKLVLNMISTGVMIQVGRTYGNLMTDMQMSNIKLRKRAAVIVAEATELPIDDAAGLLESCGGEMKTAIASYLLHLSPSEARARLLTYNGNLYRTLQPETTTTHYGE